MALDDDIQKAIEETDSLHLRYMKMSYDAQSAGQPEMAGMMKVMADDEREHADTMRRMHTSMHDSPEIMRSMHESERYYWQLENKSTGEIIFRSDQLGQDTVQEAVTDAKSVAEDPDYDYRGDVIQIKVFTKPSDERTDADVPVHFTAIEWGYIPRQAADELLGRISQSMDISEQDEGLGNPGSSMMSQEEADKMGMGEMHRTMMGGQQSSRILFPRTTGDWSDLAGRIKDFDPQNMSLQGEVNKLLTDIYDDEDGAADSKRKLFDLAIGFGIS